MKKITRTTNIEYISILLNENESKINKLKDVDFREIVDLIVSKV